MTALLRRCALVAALLTSTAAGATTPDEERDLYLDAMRLMSQGHQEQASAALERLIAVEPQHAGAWLDLAISQCALGHAADAERLFREIEVRFAPNAGILEVINGHRRNGCRPWEPKRYRSFGLARGHDSNVNQGASDPVFATGTGADRIEHVLTDDYLPHADSYTQASFDYSRELNAGGSVALAQVRVRHHDSLASQDTNALLVGIEQPLRLGGWDARAVATVGTVSLDGRLYQRQGQLQGRVTPKLGLPDSLELALAGSVGHIAYLRRSNFDANTGEASVLFNYTSARTRIQSAAGALIDRGDAARLGGNRHGWYSSMQWQHAIGARYLSELGWTRQDWRGQLAYSPGLIDAVRLQSTRQWRAALSMNVSEHQVLQLEWRHVQNKENISLFQYNSQALQLNWRWNDF